MKYKVIQNKEAFALGCLFVIVLHLKAKIMANFSTTTKVILYCAEKGKRLLA
jgi:hypothetical protein